MTIACLTCPLYTPDVPCLTLQHRLLSPQNVLMIKGSYEVQEDQNNKADTPNPAAPKSVEGPCHLRLSHFPIYR